MSPRVLVFPKTLTIRVYKGIYTGRAAKKGNKKERGGWRWQAQSGSKVVAASTESYRNKTDCLHNLTLVTGIGLYDYREFDDEFKVKIEVNRRDWHFQLKK